MYPCLKAGLFGADPDRRAVLVATDVCESSHGRVDNVTTAAVLVWAALAEMCNGNEYQAWVHAGQGLIAQLQAVEVAGGIRFDEKAGAGGQASQYLPAIGRSDVQGYAPLIEVVDKPMEAALIVGQVMVEGAYAPVGVSTGRLDLDDVGTEVSEHPPAGESLGIGQVEYPVGIKQGRHSVDYSTIGIGIGIEAPFSLSLLRLLSTHPAGCGLQGESRLGWDRGVKSKKTLTVGMYRVEYRLRV